jgi:NAD(P)-dependent dehydrogenase (short-subunit alcohol dehydrogenase family)
LDRLKGHVAVVTGASRGLGRAIAERFELEGAKTVTPNRQALSSGGFSIPENISILVNCAGMYGPIGPFNWIDEWLEWLETIRINLLLSVATCQAVLPYMKSRGYGKIIQISGGGATRGMPNYSAYASSKAAVVRFAETIALELKGTGIDVNSMSPGALNTRMKDQALAAGADPEIYKDADENMRKACDLAVFLASAESDGITGRLISAVWDKWQDENFRELLADPDAFTLRRNLPKTVPQ